MDDDNGSCLITIVLLTVLFVAVALCAVALNLANAAAVCTVCGKGLSWTL